MIFGAICALCHCPAHAAQTVDIEQVSINKPDIRVYFYTGSGRAIKKEQVSARLGDESCSVRKVYLYKKSSVGIRYYLLVDISASVPAAYFEQYKQAILSLVDKMDAQDELVLISFGDKIRTEYEGKGNKNKIRAALSDLKNDNQNTLFYEAIQKTVSYVDESNDDKRNVVAVFSDGEDWARGSVTKRETRNTLLEKQIPLYAMAVDMGHEQWIDTFGEFARETGGRIYLLSPGQIQQSLVRLQKDLKKATVAEFEAETNLVSGKKETFLLTFDGGDLRKSVKVVPYKWKKDKKPPTITRAEAVGKDQIKLVFSEDVEQAATPSNYELERNRRFPMKRKRLC